MSAKKFISNHLDAYIKLKIFINSETDDNSEQIRLLEKNFFQKRSINFYKINDDLISILLFFKIDINKFFKRNLKFEKLRNEFLNSIFYSLDERKELFCKIIDMSRELESSPYSIDLLMMKYIYFVSVIEDYSKIDEYVSYFSIILPFLSDYYKKLYYLFLLSYLDNTSKYKNITELYNSIALLPCKDDNINGRLYYIGFSIFRSLGNIDKAKKCYSKAKIYFNKVQNIAMLENLNLKYSGLLRISGNLEAALHNDLKLLEDYTIKQYRLRNIEILYNNIAWTYSLLHDYRKAVIYYQKALDTLKDNDVYYNMAYCLYKIEEYNLSQQYIELGKYAPESNSFAKPFLCWLELMIEDKYSEKTYQTLVNILHNHGNDLEELVRDTIQIEIINYYYYNGMYEEAINALQPLMGKQLISPSELIFAKDNGKNEHDTLSFDDMDDTWNDKMIIKDDDLFFDDEKINDDDWEELDDSFSSFAFN